MMKLIEALTILSRDPSSEPVRRRYFLACGFTPLHLTTFIRAHAALCDPAASSEILTGLYGDMVGNLERARTESVEAALVVVEWPDLDSRLGVRQLGGWSPSNLHDILRSAESTLTRIQAELAPLAQHCPVLLCMPTLPLPPIAFTPLRQGSSFELRLKELASSLAVWAAGLPGVRVLSMQYLDHNSPPGERFDIRSELSAGFPYCLSHASALGELFGALMAVPRPKKGVITDLDGTLWRGVLGDDGIDGISWDLDGHSAVHGLYQQFLCSLADAGILVGVASKNDPELVQEAFGRRQLHIPADKIFPFQVHWGAKSESVRRILQDWNIGPDSAVFVDDSPMELGEVRAAHPEVECLLFDGRDADSVYRLMHYLRDSFGKAYLQAEDTLRSASLKTSRLLAETESAGAQEKFLRECQGTIEFKSGELSDPRAFELVNKTNQFNINGRRYTDLSWRAYLQAPGAFLLTASYHDKFGPLGKVAALLGRTTPSSEIVIDSWVMSCRAFSRRIEHHCLHYLFESMGAEAVVVDWEETPRNGPTRDFLSSFPALLQENRLTREDFQRAGCPLFHAVKERANVVD